MNEGCMTFIFFAIIITICIGLSSALEYTQCSQVGKALNYKTEWHYFTGCIVDKPGGKVLLKQMRELLYPVLI